MIFTYEHISTQEEVRIHIQKCEGTHTQQAIYSTFHDALTQVCFGCKKIRSTIYIKEDKMKNIYIHSGGLEEPSYPPDPYTDLVDPGAEGN